MILRTFSLLILALALAGCAGLPTNSPPFPPGTREIEVQARWGPPSLHWTHPDGSRQLAYATGPMGTRTWMIWLDTEGHLIRIDQVLSTRWFAKIQPGMTKQDVLQTLGPPYAPWTAYFKARDELVWEWRYCDDWGELARFDVLLDNTRGTVRSTLGQTERTRFNVPRVWCSQ